MRHFLFLPFLLAASFAFAQSKTPDSYSKNQNAPAAKPQQADCYVRKLDAGTSALRRGDYRVALRLFEEAKTCPEAKSSSRRIKELEARIEFCNTKLGKTAVAESEDLKTNRRTETIETTGRKFNASQALKNNTDPNCFKLTVKEADRAFRDSCWDDAAKLYRAAKTCADANQLDREQMNTKIEACRAAAEDELLQKEQKAIRTARHALAANLANDAADFLRKGDRTMAWRLADFANFYVAPDDNPQCLEAMYGAYFYNPQTGDANTIRPPFCYQLSEDLSSNVQFKFFKNKSGERLTAFLPTENKTISWELPSMKIIESFSTEGLRTPVGFDFSPDGGLMFYGYNYFYLPNGQTKEVTQVSKYCFSEDGDLFFYHDVASGEVLTINLNQSNRIQQQQQRKSTSNIGRINPIPTNIPARENLQSMKSYKGELWLAYPDRVEVLARDKATGAMLPRLTWHFADSILQTNGVEAVRIFPETREALVSSSGATYYYFLNLPLADTSVLNVWSTRSFTGKFEDAVVSADKLLVLKSEQTFSTGQHFASVIYPNDNTVHTQFNDEYAFSYSASTVLSPDAAWVVCQDGANVTRLWALKDTSSYKPSDYILGASDYLSPDGNRVFSNTRDTLQVFDADDLDGGAQVEMPLSKTNYYLPLGNTNKWAVGMSAENQLSIQQLSTRELRHFDVTIGPNAPTPFAFDETESRYFAYSAGNGRVVVQALNGNQVIASKDFDGDITLLRSIPGSDQLLVVIRSGDRFTVKIWNFSMPGESPLVVRLQGYPVVNAQVSEQGNRLALSSGADIRIFLLDNLNDEAVVIKSYKNSYINDFTFRPDGLALALSDSDGRVMAYDAVSGQLLLRFYNIWEGVNYPVNRLSYAYGGIRLRLVASGRLFTINLDAYSLREVVQSGDRQLVSFTSDQIRDYNLEIAFKYAGNFDRLAESEDYPLIRSFFQYFRDQSQSSNNMEQVRTYCERAFKLYELLDANGQANLEFTMFQMYENYILKLLLRDAGEEASRVVMFLEKRFGRPSVAIISAAHCSLARHDLKAASRLYTDYLLRLPNDGLFQIQLDDINAKASQFQEYDLLDTAQVNCLCEVFQQFPNFSKLCPASKKYTLNPYSKQVAIFQQVYMALDSIASIYAMPDGDKVKGLENIVTIARGLDYPNPVVEKHPLEMAEIALADAYIAQATFEQNSPKTPVIYQKAIDLLEKQGPFTGIFDTARLSRLVNLHLLYGNYHLDNDKPVEAVLQFNTALAAGKKLMARYPFGTLSADRIGTAYLSPEYLALCRARLLEGKIDEARKAFGQAAEYAELKRENVLNGHAALLENDEIEAFLAYGSIESAGDLGEALFQINQMAELLPMHRPRLLAFIPRLRNAYLANHQMVTVEEVNYWQATLQVSRYSAQCKWDSAFSWASTALRNVNTLMARPELAGTWMSTWLDQSLANTYFLLISHPTDTFALSEVVRYSNEVLQYITTNNPYYQYKNYYYSNLGHALWLRNRPGDREKAVDAYHDFLEDPEYDGSWELLVKDFIDLHRAGIRWQGIKNLIQQIIPKGKEVTPEQWQEMGE